MRDAEASDADEALPALVGLEGLDADPPPGAPVPPILPPQDGFLFLDREKFRDSFAADVTAEDAEFMADSQVPWGVDALGGEVTEPAWKAKPSWYLVTTEDRMIPPLAQRAMSERAGSTVVEVPGSHAIYVSQPQAVGDLIEQAATSIASSRKAFRPVAPGVNRRTARASAPGLSAVVGVSRWSRWCMALRTRQPRRPSAPIGSSMSHQRTEQGLPR
jgi:hypothetical protein